MPNNETHRYMTHPELSGPNDYNIGTILFQHRPSKAFKKYSNIDWL
jgi:hypothetical protein